MTKSNRNYTIFALTVMLALGACSSAPDAPDTVEGIAEEPRAAAGRTVTVEGRVSQVLGECAYLIEGKGLLDNSAMLTLCDPTSASQPPPPVPDAVAAGDWLRVTGTPGEMTREDYEFKTTLTLPDELFEKTETHPVIFVRSAELIETPREDEARLPKGPVVVPIL